MRRFFHCLFIIIAGLTPLSGWAKSAQTNYMLECQGCHLADGSGGHSHIPNLNNAMARFLQVPGGREYLVQVPGVALSALSDSATAEVLNWMLATFGPAEIASQYSPYTAREVAALRQSPLADVALTRSALELLMSNPLTGSLLE